MSHAELRRCLQDLCSPGEIAHNLEQNRRFAKQCQHRCELLTKISWLGIYAMVTKWAPGWITKFDRTQFTWIALSYGLHWQLTEWGNWYREVADILQRVESHLESSQGQVWLIQQQLAEYL